VQPAEQDRPDAPPEGTFGQAVLGEGIAGLFRPNTRLLYLESPGSQTFEVQDVPLLARIARERGAVTVVDNTWATPLYFQPLRHGADVAIHAATKYIGGHADLFLGTVTCNEPSWRALRATVSALGLTASPDDCWLALRGLRSMGARLAQQRATTDRLVQWLREQPEVLRVLYPALPDDPGHALWRRDFTGATGLFGVLLQPAVGRAALERLVDATRLFGHGYSWGGFESLLIPSHPERNHPALPADALLLRISVGLEAAGDLLADLDQAFARIRAGA